MPTWPDVVASAMRFPGVEETTSYGRPSLKARKWICSLRTNPDALVIPVADLQDKEALLQSKPDVLFTIPHYDGYPAVLVHLDRIDPALLDELVEDAWRMGALKRDLKAYDAAET